MMKTVDKKTEANILVTYLLKTSVDDTRIYDLYETIVGDLDNEERLVSFAFRHPKLLPSLDASLVFLRPNSELRRRIYIMFAILETMPQYSKDFLPQEFRFKDYLYISGAGIRAILRLIIGIVIVKMGRL